MPARKIVPLIALLMLVGVPQPAHAALWSGACALDVRFVFSEPIQPTGSNPNYTVTVTPAVDLDTGWPGSQPCLSSLDVDPFRSTSVVASGSSSLWTCGAVLASGPWDQGWQNQAGAFTPPAVFGSHSITGAWGAWTVLITSPSLNFTGVIELTLDTGTPTPACIGATSVRTTGVMVFQDPS